jgi:hypothetical protein
MSRKRKSGSARRPVRKARKTRLSAKPLPRDEFVSAGAHVLALKIDRTWMPGVRGHLDVILRHGNSVAEFALQDEADPAPVFEA